MSPPSPTDLELVRGLHARDPKALAHVYGDYHAAVYAVTHDSATAPEALSGTTSTTGDTHDGGDADHDDGH